MPYYYAFCPSDRAWQHMQKTTKRDLGWYPPARNIKACCTLLQNYKDEYKRVAIVTVGDYAPEVTVNLLVHEAVHVWEDMCEAIDERKPSSEFMAYGIQVIAFELFKAYERTRGPLFAKFINQRPSK